MTKVLHSIELVSTRHPSYRANNSRYRKMAIQRRKPTCKDHFTDDYNKALLKWESAAQGILSKLVNERKARILRYSETGTIFLYREIDFIAEHSPEQLVLCEIKLKQRYNSSLGSKASGWRQLDKSLAIAKHRFQDVSGLAICVDMSWVYGIDSAATDNDYLTFSDIKSHIDSAAVSKNTIWLSSRELSGHAIKYGLLKPEDVIYMKELFMAFSNPFSTIEDCTYEPNYAFGSLINLKNDR
jgi:hypothetical protein